VERRVYGQPLGSIGLSRVDVRDIADALVTVALEDGYAGQSYPVVGPDVLTGPQCAAVWSQALDRQVRYGGDDLGAWAAQVGPFLPAWLLEDLKIMYAFFQREGLRASTEDLARQALVLGHPPRRFEDFCRETAAGWTS
jgi:uncharacterized protein YbjT (DUF2867 family)